MHSQLSCHCPSTRTLAFSWFSSPSSQKHTPSTLSFSSNSLPVSSLRLPHCPALKTSNGGRLGSQDANDPSLLRKPSFSSSSADDDDDDDDDGLMKKKGGFSDESMDVVENSEPKSGSKETDSKWVDWEDQILEDTVPLVGFVRMILHSGKYESGARLSQEHEKIILERLLPYHPEYEKKIGCGIDFITTGYHPDFESSRCLFIVRKDGELVDFSFWKCIKGLIRKKYPLYADSFILRHFRRQRHNE